MSIENRSDFIMGAGLAGLQARHHVQRAGMRCLILESCDALGGFFRAFPRQRILISVNKRHAGYDDAEIKLRWGWNALLAEESDPLLFRQNSGCCFPAADDLPRYMDIVELSDELLVDYTHEKWNAEADPYRVCTLECSRQKFDNPFNVSRISRDNVEESAGSNSLHSVWKFYVNENVICGLHVIEDLAAEWREPEHILPSRNFLCNVMVPTVVS